MNLSSVKAFFLSTVLCVTMASPLAAQQSSPPQERALAEHGIRAAINHYFRGHATADSVQMRMAFLPTAHIEGIREGKFTSWTVAEYASRFQGRPAPDEAQRLRTIDLIDVSGNSAMVKATLVHGATTFTDYFVMLKVGDEWKIANKVYYGARTSGAASPGR